MMPECPRPLHGPWAFRASRHGLIHAPLQVHSGAKAHRRKFTFHYGRKVIHILT